MKLYSNASYFDRKNPRYLRFAAGLLGMLLLILTVLPTKAAVLYIGDAAAMGDTVTAGTGYYSINSLTLAFAQLGTTYTNISGSTLTLQITEVNFFQSATGAPGATLTPFVAIYSGSQTPGDVSNPSNYSVIQKIEIPSIVATALTNDEERNIIISGAPTFTLGIGQTLVAGYYSVGGTGDLVQQVDSGTGLIDFVGAGNRLPGSLPAAFTGGGNDFDHIYLDRQQRFNIGINVVPEPSSILLMGLGLVGIFASRTSARRRVA